MEGRRLVVLSGAGISAESGLATFRDNGGLWETYRVEEVAAIEAWRKDPRKVLHFYNQRRTSLMQANPNKAHHLLADLQAFFKVQIITQNIDDLHERAGSRQVLHLHGELNKMRSTLNAEKLFPYNRDIHLGDQAPDGGQFRPHVVWFGEDVPYWPMAAGQVSQADILLIIGTSLQVYPAAGLLHFAPESIPKYIIDPRTMDLPGIPELEHINMTAIRGMEQLFPRLLGNQE